MPDLIFWRSLTKYGDLKLDLPTLRQRLENLAFPLDEYMFCVKQVSRKSLSELPVVRQEGSCCSAVNVLNKILALAPGVSFQDGLEQLEWRSTKGPMTIAMILPSILAFLVKTLLFTPDERFPDDRSFRKSIECCK
jgi:hypothetical protein